MKKIYLFLVIGCLTVINAFAQTPCSISITSAPGTDAQSVCKNTPITDITYQFSGALTAVSGLPSGTNASFSTGAVTISGTPTIEGQYNYTVTTTDGCAPDSSATGTITVGIGLLAAGTDNQSVCINTAITTIDYTITDGATPNVTGLPSGVVGSSTGPSVFTISGTPNVSGTFNYTINTTGSCATQSQLTGTITVNPIPTTTVNNATICAGNTVTLTAGGATTYAWSGGFPAGATLTDAPTVTTSYTVTGTTAGCSSSDVGTVTAIPLDDASFSYTPATVCKTGGTDPVPTITGTTGGTFSSADAGLTINSSTGVIDLATTPIGTYTVTYSISGQCLSSSDFVISIVSAPDATFAYSGPYCQNAPNPSPVFPFAATAGVFTVAPAGLTFVSTNTGEVDLTASSPGAYTVTNTIAAGGGCPASAATNTITINSVPTIATSSAAICAGQAGGATLTANSDIAGTTFIWSPGGFNTSSINVSPSTTTSYTVSGTAMGCSGQAVGTVTVNQTPVINVSSPTVCAGQPATLTAAGGATYTWSTGATGNSMTVSPATTTSYTVSDNTAGCSGQAVATVTVHPTPSVTVNSPTICAGESALLNANGADTYTWSNGATTGTIVETITTTTSYTVTGVSFQGCMSKATTTITVLTSACTPLNTPLTISVSSTDASNSSICNGTAYATVTGGVPPYSINFGNTTVTDSVYAITNLCAGFYTANATDAQSNSTSFTFVVGSPATTFAFTDLTFTDSVVVDTLVTNGIVNCVIDYDAIDSITITNSSYVGSDSINVIWTIYQGGTNTTQNANYQFSIPGVYTFILDLFCTNRATGSVKGIDQVYINKSATGIETYTHSNLSVYPNPSSGSLTIKSLNEGTYSIVNELGQTVQQFKLSAANQYVVNIENLNNGVYFIVGINNNLITHQKIVVIE